MDLFNLEKHFSFYGAYHRNPINILIHSVLVWPIFCSYLVLLYFTPSIRDLFGLGFIPSHLDQGLALNLGFVYALVYAAFYVCLDKKAGTLGALLCMSCWVGSSALAARLGFSLAWKVVLAVQAFCWTWQLIGHGVFEKRSPAFMDSFAQAFLMAPYFMVLETLQLVFGYEPYPGFRKSVESKMEVEINEWKERMEKKAV